MTEINCGRECDSGGRQGARREAQENQQGGDAVSLDEYLGDADQHAFDEVDDRHRVCGLRGDRVA